MRARFDPQLENWKQTYDEIEQQRRSRLFARGFSTALNWLYRPHVSYLEGAEEEVRAAVEGGKSILYAVNHRSEQDPNVAQGGLASQPLFRPRIGHGRVLAKGPLFEGGRLKPVRLLTEQMGGIAVLRDKDYPEAPTDRLRAAGKYMSDITIQAIIDGYDLAVFPEGTCNKGDPRQLLRINSGLAHFAHQAVALRREEEPDIEPWFVILPVGLSYGVRPQPGFAEARHASMIVGHPIDTLEEKPFQTTQVVKAGALTVVTAAHKDYHALRGEDVPEYEPLAA